VHARLLKGRVGKRKRFEHQPPTLTGLVPVLLAGSKAAASSEVPAGVRETAAAGALRAPSIRTTRLAFNERPPPLVFG